MMANKWVQASLVLGIAIGIWLGGWIALIHPMATLFIPIPIGLVAAWKGGNARGSDGWGGPWHGPK